MRTLLLVLASLTLQPFTLHPNEGRRLGFYNRKTSAAEIRVQGDNHGGDIDCYLFDREGRFLESDTGVVDSCLLTLPARAPGHYTVVLSNVGTSTGMYTIGVEKP